MRKILIVSLSFLLVILLYFVIRSTISRTYTTKGFATKVGFPKISFNYPSGWVVKEDGNTGGDKNFAHDKITISKGGYIVTIDQKLIVGGGVCQFKDSPTPIGPAVDLTTVEYKEMESNFGHVRYFKTKDIYDFCIQVTNGYVFPTIGYVSIETPIALDNATFTEALDIVKSIKTIHPNE